MGLAASSDGRESAHLTKRVLINAPYGHGSPKIDILGQKFVGANMGSQSRKNFVIAPTYIFQSLSITHSKIYRELKVVEFGKGLEQGVSREPPFVLAIPAKLRHNTHKIIHQDNLCQPIVLHHSLVGERSSVPHFVITPTIFHPDFCGSQFMQLQ